MFNRSRNPFFLAALARLIDASHRGDWISRLRYANAPRRKPRWTKPHQGAKERARRIRQMQRGILRAENGAG